MSKGTSMYQMPAKNWVQSRSSGYTSGKVPRSLLRLSERAFVCSYVQGDIRNGQLIGRRKHVTAFVGPTCLERWQQKLPACAHPEQLLFTNTELRTGYRPPICAARTIYRAEQRVYNTLPRECGKPGLTACLRPPFTPSKYSWSRGRSKPSYVVNNDLTLRRKLMHWSPPCPRPSKWRWSNPVKREHPPGSLPSLWQGMVSLSTCTSRLSGMPCALGLDGHQQG